MAANKKKPQKKKEPQKKSQKSNSKKHSKATQATKKSQTPNQPPKKVKSHKKTTNSPDRLQILIVGLVLAVVVWFFARPSTAVLPSSAITLSSCKSSTGPEFLSRSGLPRNAAFSTAGREGTGILMYYQDDGEDKVYVNDSYSEYGNFGTIVYDEIGNTYVGSLPFIDVLKNPHQQRNTIYRVDTKTGILSPWASLPIEHDELGQPYGIVGSYYDCENRALIVSTLSDSDQDTEKGSIWSISIGDKSTSKLIENIDATAVAVASSVSGGSERNHLLVASARSNQLFIHDYKDGKLGSDKPSVFAQYKPEGLFLGARVKKIRQGEGTALDIALVPFDFDLKPGGEREEYLQLLLGDDGRYYQQ